VGCGVSNWIKRNGERVMAKAKYQMKYKLKDKKTGRHVSSGQRDVQAESETNAIAQAKKLWQSHEVEIVAVTPR
jgi:hypothetical protein